MRPVVGGLWPVLVVLLAACAPKGSKPLSPAAALNSFRLSDDFRVELFAAEPDVLDPVDMVFDENGRAFVCEMLDLPFDPLHGKAPRSRIRMLEDTNGDGRADHSTIFADGLLQTSGVLPWKGGLIVTAAPEILYLKDTDGDGRADVRKVLFTGFWKGNPEAEITNPRLAIDNWIYFSNSGNPGLIKSTAVSPLVEVRGADFRYHPLRGLAERASGPAQFGSSFDDWGNRFISQNTIHLRHVIVPMNYLARAPLLAVPAVVKDIYAPEYLERRMFPLTPPPHWRVERTRLRQQRYQELASKRIERVGGYISGASGGTVYTGDVFPEPYRGTVFTGDVSGNLVRHDRLTPDGVTFLARPARDGVEFLASTDPWFRPTSFANAPDGNLYITDIYREVIETPLSIPEELKKQLDFYRGDDRGRIWRLAPNRPVQRRSLQPNLATATVARLVGEFENRNGWHRATAQRLLIERQDRAAVPPLRELARGSAFPQASVHALWTLEGLGALEAGDVLAALEDPEPRIREHAVRLSESLDPSPALEKALIGRRRDADLRVRFQLAFTLGNYQSAAAREALAGLAAEHGDDPWFRTAVLTSAAGAPAEFFERMAARKAVRNGPLVAEIAALIGARRNTGEIRSLLATPLENPEPALEGLARGLQLAGARSLPGAAIEPLLAGFLDHPAEAVREAAWRTARFFRLGALVSRAERTALDGSAPASLRAAALTALEGGPFALAARVARRILASNPPAEIQQAAIGALASFDDPSVTAALLENWRSYSPPARARTIAVILNQRRRVPALLDALESGRIEPAALDIAARNRLLEFPDPDVAGRARRVLRIAGGDRARVVENYSEVLRLTGGVAAGKIAFERHCAECHRPRRQGSRVGPDLSGVNNRTREELLAAILNPSASIESRYTNYLVTTRDGRLLDGILINETPGTITLRGGANEDVTLLRTQVADIRSSSISLMPEDLETAMSKQDLADVIRYLRGGL